MNGLRTRTEGEAARRRLGFRGHHTQFDRQAFGMMSPDCDRSPTVRSDVTLSGGRSGQKVKNLTAPINSAVRGANGRVCVTNDKGQVILDMTRKRVKPVIPGQGLGPKRAPTPQELELIKRTHAGGAV